MAHTLATATQPNEIDSIVDLIHDWYFDMDAVSTMDQTLRVRFEATKRELEKPAGRGRILEIRNVVSVKIVDREQIGFYSLNELTYVSRPEQVVLECNVPLEFSVGVSGLSIAVSAA